MSIVIGSGITLGAGISALQEIPQNFLWAWGRNNYGQLGIGNIANRSSPVQVGALGTWSQINACQGTRGFAHAVKTDGTLWSWGANYSGQLGLGNTVYRSSPVQVGALTNWTNSLMPNHYPGGACHVKSGGTAWFFGRLNNMFNNAFGVSVSSPVQVASDKTWAVTVTGTNISWFGITTGGALWSSCGDTNTAGMSGQNNTTNTSSPAQVGALTDWAGVYPGSNGVIARKTDGTLWSWGSASTANPKAFLGQNDAVTRSSPTQIGSLTTWAKVSVAVYGALAVKTNGTLWSWGYNGYGVLGLGDNISRSSPTQVGALTNWLTTADKIGMVVSGGAIAVKDDGTLFTWGRPYWGTIGNNTGGITTHVSSPTQLGSLTTWTKVGVNYQSVFAIASHAT